jgi:hypothetical protein
MFLYLLLQQTAPIVQPIVVEPAGTSTETWIGFATIMATIILGIIRSELAARHVADKTEQTAMEISHKLELTTLDNKQSLSQQTSDIQDGLRENMDAIATNTIVTKEGAATAKDAYNEANQVNRWRAEMDKRIEGLNKLVERLATSIEAQQAATANQAPQKVTIEGVSPETLQAVKDLVPPPDPPSDPHK